MQKSIIYIIVHNFRGYNFIKVKLNKNLGDEKLVGRSYFLVNSGIVYTQLSIKYTVHDYVNNFLIYNLN